MAAALGVYTHLSMGFFVLAHFLLCIWPTMRGANAPALVNWRRPATGFLLAATLPLLLYAPMLPQMFQVFARPSPLRNIATHDWAFLQILHGFKVGFGTWGAAVGLVLLACGARDYFYQNRFVLTLSVLTAAITAAGTFILRLPMQPRFFFILIGFASLIAVRGAIVLGNWVACKWRTVSGLTLNSRSVGISLAGAMILANVMSLGYLYRYPKQDYAGAMRYLETHRSPEEPVIVAPKSLRDYYGRDWLTVENKDELPIPESGRAWILYTLPQYMRPMLGNSIRQKCPQVVAFHGTLSGGDVFVCATPPKNAQHKTG